MDELLLIISYFWRYKSKPHLKDSEIKCDIKSLSFQHFPSATIISREKRFILTTWTGQIKLQVSVLFLHRPCRAGAVSPSLIQDKNVIFSMHLQPLLVHEFR